MSSSNISTGFLTWNQELNYPNSNPDHDLGPNSSYGRAESITGNQIFTHQPNGEKESEDQVTNSQVPRLSNLEIQTGFPIMASPSLVVPLRD